jgi:hypothetical protein
MQDGALIISEEQTETYLSQLKDSVELNQKRADALAINAKSTKAESQYQEIKEEIDEEVGGKLISRPVWGTTAYERAVKFLVENQDINSADELAKSPFITKELAEALIENKESIIKNSIELSNLTKSADLVRVELVKSLFKNDPIVQNSEYKDAFYRFGSEILEREKEKALKISKDYNFAISWGAFGDYLGEGADTIVDYLAARYGVTTQEVADNIKWGETGADMFGNRQDSQVVTYTINGITYEDEKITEEDLR